MDRRQFLFSSAVASSVALLSPARATSAGRRIGRCAVTSVARCILRRGPCRAAAIRDRARARHRRARCSSQSAERLLGGGPGPFRRTTKATPRSPARGCACRAFSRRASRLRRGRMVGDASRRRWHEVSVRRVTVDALRGEPVDGAVPERPGFSRFHASSSLGCGCRGLPRTVGLVCDGTRRLDDGAVR